MKSNKQKCIEMWTWLSENPGKGKRQYAELMSKETKDALNQCWACEEAGLVDEYIDPNCSKCPIDFLACDADGCEDSNSPYEKWCEAEADIVFFENSKEVYVAYSKKYAKEFLQLIKDTWVE